jgi:Ca2+-binding RTX toxin-like protein
MATFSPNQTRTTPTNRDDFLFGSSSGERIFARGGADTVYALGGDDEVYGEGQDDVLDGGTGDDLLNGGSGDDVLEGRDGRDFLEGSTNDDILRGGGEDDFLVGGLGSDYLSGGGEDDNINWADGDGSDVVDGGGGNDVLSLFTADSGGTSSFTGERFEISAVGVETLIQRISENPFNQRVSNVEDLEFFLAGGADTVVVSDLSGTGVGSITLFGGDGSERISSSGSTPLLVFGEGQSDFLTGSSGDDEFHGGDRGDRIGGNAGNDQLFGDDGDDTLTGGTGNDIINGGEGEDGIVGGADNDTLTGEAGADQFRYDLPPVGGGQDVITDFATFSDDLFLGGTAEAVLDTNTNGLIDDGDDAASLVDGDLSIEFGSNNTLKLIGVDSLDFGNNVFIV